jgi:hypothetical protein
MKKIGIAAAILIVALLMTGVVSALESHEKVITIKRLDKDTAVTNDGEIIHMTFHAVTNETGIGSMDETPETVVNVERAGPGLIKIGSEIVKTQTVTKTLSLMGVSGSLSPGYADYWGAFSWNSGATVSASASWTPTNQNVYLGIYDDASGQGSLSLRTGGSGTYTTTVPWTSNQWYWCIYSPTSNTATVYYTLN